MIILFAKVQKNTRSAIFFFFIFLCLSADLLKGVFCVALTTSIHPQSFHCRRLAVNNEDEGGKHLTLFTRRSNGDGLLITLSGHLDIVTGRNRLVIDDGFQYSMKVGKKRILATVCDMFLTWSLPPSVEMQM